MSRLPRLLAAALLLLTVQSFGQRSRAVLRESDEYWNRDRRPVPVRVSRLTDKQKVAVVGDTLYMLDTNDRILWSWSSYGPPLVGNPIVDSQGTLYAIGLDLLWVAIDATTGVEKWRGTANGKALYSQLKLYQNDKYFVVTNMEAYREKGPSPRDILTLCKGNDILWEIDVPPNTRLDVRDGYAVMIRRKTGRIEQKTRIPEEFAKLPIGKVSVDAK